MIIVKMKNISGIVILFLVACAVGGCSGLDVRIQNMLGMQRGFFIQTYDSVVLPSEEVTLRMKLKTGQWMNDEENRAVKFILNGKTYASTITDDEGEARVPFTPPTTGDWVFTVDVDPEGFKNAPPASRLTVTCRDKNSPIAVVDIDGTLMGPEFDKVLTGDPPPLANSVEVLKRLSADYTIVYLTHRPEFLGQKSKAWLDRHGFVPGPVLLAPLKEFVKGSQRYKIQMLGRLKSSFAGMTLGIGDKISDTTAYLQNNMRALMILHVKDPDQANDVRRQADKLEQLPPSTQVLYGWDEVEAVIYQNKTFPPQRAVKKLRLHAAALESSKWKWLRWW